LADLLRTAYPTHINGHPSAAGRAQDKESSNVAKWVVFIGTQCTSTSIAAASRNLLYLQVFETVSVTVNIHWITAMERCDPKCPGEILEDVCQKIGVKLECSSADKYVISGHLEAVTRTMNEVHAIDWKRSISARQQHQQQTCDRPHVTENDRSDSSVPGKNNAAAIPPAGRHRRLKAHSGTTVEVRNIESKKQQTDSDSKQEKDNKLRLRRLKVLTASGEPEPEVYSARSDSQDEADTQHGETITVETSRRLKPSSSITGNMERSALNKSIILKTVKHHHIISHLGKELQSITGRCSSFGAQENEDDTEWTYEAKNREELNDIEIQLTKIISLLSSADIAIPVGVDVESVKAVCAVNKYSNSVTIDVNERERLCLVCGTDAAEVKTTMNWLKDELSTCQTDTPHRRPQPQNPEELAGAVGHDPDKSKSHAARTKCDFVTHINDRGDALELTTVSGINVHIHQADMLRQQTEVIVNSANDQLAHGGGLARAILTAGGPTIDEESRRIIADRGSLGMGDVVHTSGGNIPPPVRYVIHAVPPSGHQMKTCSRHECMNALIQAFYGSMQYANDELGASSISMPPFGAGMCHVTSSPID